MIERKKMRVNMKKVLLILIILSISLVALSQTTKRDITAEERSAVIMAVEDEIYDYSFQEKFTDVGGFLGHMQHQLHLYIRPDIDSGYNTGQVIYKLMPYGEVIRTFVLFNDSMVRFATDPEIGFPPTQEDTKTVYLDDEQVCQMKQTWINDSFIVDLAPSLKRVKEAAQRQILRTGFSKWQSSDTTPK